MVILFLQMHYKSVCLNPPCWTMCTQAGHEDFCDKKTRYMANLIMPLEEYQEIQLFQNWSILFFFFCYLISRGRKGSILPRVLKNENQ